MNINTAVPKKVKECPEGQEINPYKPEKGCVIKCKVGKERRAPDGRCVYVSKASPKSPKASPKPIREFSISPKQPKPLKPLKPSSIRNFLKQIKHYQSAKELIADYKNKDGNEAKTDQGFIYEKLWDICIKLGITEMTDINTHHAIGNFNIIKDTQFETIKDYFDNYIEEGIISGNSGGYSDITFVHNKILHLVSVKYIEGKDIKDFDLQNLCTIIADRKKHEYDDIKVLLFVKDKKAFIKLCKDTNQSSNLLINYISANGRNGNYENVYDLNDLEIHFYKLKRLLELYGYFKDNPSKGYIENFKAEYLKFVDKNSPFIPRFHQELFIEKINTLVNRGVKQILVGAIPRSGKTYIMAGSILRHAREHTERELKNGTPPTYNNYVIITPAPNETLPQYKEVFDNHIDFKRYNIEAGIIKTESNLDFNENKGKHFVYLISKQRLGNVKGDSKDAEVDVNIYMKNIKKYFGEKNNINMIFMDEAHFGMATDIAQQIVKCLNTNNSVKIFVTATYNKPQKEYGIDRKNLIKWDLEDIKMIKNMTSTNFNDADDADKKRRIYEAFRKVIIKFAKTFSDNILKKVLRNYGWKWDNTTLSIKMLKDNRHIINNIIKQYRYFPEPYFITSVWDKDFFTQQQMLLKPAGDENKTNYGFSMEKLFLHKNNSSFANEEQLIQLYQYYFGYPATEPDKTIKMGYDIQNDYKMKGVMPRIERICNNNCRTLQTPLHKTTQLWFLPHDHIAKIMNALLHLLDNKFNYIFKKYMFYVADNMPKFGDTFANTYKNVEYMTKAENIKRDIRELERKIRDDAEYSKYDGLIILAGGRLQLGISLENVDIVALFTNITATDAIYQMIFRSMTEIDDGAVCDGSSFCSNKKYGFMVDLNPQRTLYTLEYFADRLTNKNRDEDDDKGNDKARYSIIADLINIDKDKFINKYDTEEDNKNYVKEFFDKLNHSWEINAEHIKNVLKEQNIFTDDIKVVLNDGDFDIRRLFNEEDAKGKGKGNGKDKEAVILPEDAFSGGKMRIKDIYEGKQNAAKAPKKGISVIDMWYDIISEAISILSFITSYSKLECIFSENKITDFNYEILKIFDEINHDEYLKDIFIYYLKKRVIKRDAITNDNLFNMVYNIIKIINEKHIKISRQSGGHIGINKIIQMKKEKIYNIKNPDELLVFINENLAPKKIETKTRGEVFTPMGLVNEMLDKLPKDVWENKDLKWLDPAAGMGNFPVAVYMRLMDGLKGVIDSDESRRKHILEKMLYMVEIDKANVFMINKIFCGGTYKLNIFEGSFINYQAKYKEVVINNKYDIILGNPPFQYKEDKLQAQSIWRFFVERSYRLLEKNGYILMIHPSGWRDIGGRERDIFDFMKAHNLIYLNMKDFKTGKKIFDVGTNFDYYLVQNTLMNSNKTTINDYDNTKGKDEEYEIDLNRWEFIPSGKFKDFRQIIAKKNEEKANVFRSTLYHTQGEEMSKTKTDFPCCYSITIKDGMKYRYSNIDKGHFGIPKVIWSNGSGTYPIVDKIGEYGLTEYCYGIIDKKDKLNDIKDAMEKPLFLELMKYLVFKEDHKYNYKIISLFKKDFYKYFLDKKSSSRE